MITLVIGTSFYFTAEDTPGPRSRELCQWIMRENGMWWKYSANILKLT